MIFYEKVLTEKPEYSTITIENKSSDSKKEDKTMMTNTERELRRLITEAGFEAITVTMKCNGDKVTIDPCCYAEKPSFEATEFYLIDSESLPSTGRDTLDEVARYLLKYADLIKENDDDIERLKKYIREYGKDSDWSWVSDYHKDLFGHRPHVGADMLIAWAHSDSKGSARLYAERSNPLIPGTYAWGKEFYY